VRPTLVTHIICNVKTLRNNPTARMTNMVMRAGVGDEFDFPGFEKLDHSKVPMWLEQLKKAQSSIRKLRARLQTLLDLESATAECRGCGAPMVGRTDKEYCKPACRQRAYRLRYTSKS
jgi:hypothetical protein